MNVSRCFWYGALLFLSTTTVARSEERTTKSPYESLYPLFALDPLHRSQRKRNETLVLSAAVVVNESVPFNFDCSRREGAFTKHGPAVQIIHVPKSGGTSIREMFKKIAQREGMTVNMADNYGAKRNEAKGARKVRLRRGEMYLGHRAIGWGSSSSLESNFYMVALREPFAWINSLYNFKAASPAGKGGRPHRLEVEHIQKAEAILRNEGVPADRMLDELLVRRDSSVERMLKNYMFHSYLLPHHCWSAMKDGACSGPPSSLLGSISSPNISNSLSRSLSLSSAIFASSLRNLLRTDIVVATDRMEDVTTQLLFHAPHLSLMEKGGGRGGDGKRAEPKEPPLQKGLVVPHLNAGESFAEHHHHGGRPTQSLGASTAALVRSWPEFQISQRLYSLSLRIAAAKRTREVAQAVGNGTDFFGGSRRRSGNQSCRILVSEEELVILNSMDERGGDSVEGQEASGASSCPCDVHKPLGQAATRTAPKNRPGSRL